MDTAIAKKKKSDWDKVKIDPDDFFDLVAKQKHQLDTLFSLKLWRPEPSLYPEETNSVIEKVLISPRVKEIIIQVVFQAFL